MANNVSSDIDIAEFMLPGTYLSSGAGHPVDLFPAVFIRSVFCANLSEMRTISADGAFKIRGAANTILGELQNEQRIRRNNGVVTASTVAWPTGEPFLMWRKAGIPATVYLSSLVPGK